MGKGDKKTRRGKIVMGSTGVTRKKNKKKSLPKVVSKPKEIKDIPVVEKVATVVEQPQTVEVEKKEKPKKETPKKEKSKEIAAEKEPKTEKKTSAKKKD